MTVYFGIDPGINGGLAVITSNHVVAIPMPVVDKELDINAIRNFILMDHLLSPSVIYIEKVHAFPGQGVTSMFNFGYIYGQLVGLSKGLGISLHYVMPQTWKKVVLKDTDKSKDAAINYVKNTYPNVSLKATPRSIKDHDGMAEAVCIATYGMMVN